MLTPRVLQPAEPIAADGAALARVLHQAGVGKTSVVRVTGPAGLIAALWLCRHGYERAAYVHANWLGTMRSADVLIVPHACAVEALLALVGAGDGLREGGLLIAQTAPDAAAAAGPGLAARLEALGYHLEHQLADRGREICIARRVGQPGFRKAA